MKHLLTLIPLVAALTSCAAHASNDSVSADGDYVSYQLMPDLECDPEAIFWECLQQHEPVAAERYGVALTRASGDLCLREGSDTSVCVSEGGDDGLMRTFLKRIPGAYLIVEHAGEGFAVLVVDATSGLVDRVDNQPVFAPGAEVFATVSYDVDAGYMPNRVAIWSASSRDFIYATDDFCLGAGPTAIRWTGPSTLEVRYESLEGLEAGQTPDVFHIGRGADGVWTDDYKPALGPDC